MGRELQKKKNKSSIARVRQKQKSKKVNPQGNATIAANWDQSLTLSQNYRRLGLTSKLNARTGGVEKLGSHVLEMNNTVNDVHDSLAVISKTTKTLMPSVVQVERDPESGVILRVIRQALPEPNPLNDPLNELSEGGHGDSQTQRHPSGGVIKELEQQASMGLSKRARQQSVREEEWISALVEKYGENYRGMARDRKLNPNQQTEADIRRRVVRWRASNI